MLNCSFLKLFEEELKKERRKNIDGVMKEIFKEIAKIHFIIIKVISFLKFFFYFSERSMNFNMNNLAVVSTYLKLYKS